MSSTGFHHLLKVRDFFPSGMQKNAAKLQNFCIVFVSPVDAETLGVSHLDPVTVRIAGFSIEGNSWRPPPPPHPCFIIQVEDHIPKNCAYFYTKGVYFYSPLS